MFFKKILPFFAPLAFFVFLQLANRFPNQMLYWGMGGMIIAAAVLFLLRRFWLQENIEFKVFWSSVFLFLLGSFLTFVFLDRPVFRQVMIFVSSFLFFLEMYYAALFLRDRKDFYLGNLAVLNEIFPVVAFFLLAAGFFGWLVFLGRVLWVFVILISFIALETSYNLFYNSLGKKFVFASLWVIALVAAEMFWALNFLPVGFLVKAFVLTVSWWIGARFLIAYQKEKKNPLQLNIYALAAAILITIILLSSRWI